MMRFKTFQIVIIYIVSIWSCTPRRAFVGGLKNLTIGAYAPLTGPCWGGGFAVKIAMELALSQVNERTDILPEYRLHMVLNDTKCDPGVGMHILYDHIYNVPTKLMLLGAAFSPVSQPIADTSKYWNLLQVSYASTSPVLKDRELYPRFFRTISSDLTFNPARAALLRKYGWKRVATLHQNEPSGIFSQATKQLHKLLQDVGIEIVVGESFTENPANQLANIKKKDARIIIGSFYVVQAKHVFCEAYKQRMYGKRYVWIIIGWYEDKWWETKLNEDHVTCTTREMGVAVEGYLATDHMKLNEDDATSKHKTVSGWTAQEYAIKFKNLTGTNARHEASFAYDAAWAIALVLNASAQRLAERGKALENFTYADEEMADLFEEIFHNTSFLGVTGPVSFTKYGERVGYIQFEQLQGGESKRVGVYDVTTDSIMMNRKEPIKWQGAGPPSDRTVRETELKSIATGLFAFMAFVAVLGMLLGVFFLLINFLYRERRIIKMSSPRLNNVIVAGCILTYFSVILFGLDGGLVPTKRYGQVCIARAWIMSIGFTLAFGAMFAKTWRVHAIFKSITPKKKVIRDEHLFLIVAAFVLLDIFLLSLWTGIEPMHTGYQQLENKMRFEDDKEIIPVLEHCESKRLSYWLGAVYAFKGLLLVFGVFLAWETRGVTIPALNDSRYIVMSVYNVVILSILGVAITSIIRDHQDATFAITAVFTIFCTTLTLCFVFLPKVTKLWSPDGGTEASTTRRSNNPESLSSTDKNAANMMTENSQLKKQLAQREQHLMELKRLLETLPPESRKADKSNSQESCAQQFKKRKSLVQFRQPEPSYANKSFEPEEEATSKSKQRTEGSSSSGV
ncbi:gamma-aminobutyric acid type B receptor subunit 2-like [Porites lutea]|uniref:gamma-aminobutyric acid type B receptor subunit 2-like n=1 Tax=Porites lutea TaxID=51062 RepID=UPI003CC587C6